jgi:hypothetical protein
MKQATKKACEDQDAPKQVWQFAFGELTVDNRNMFLLVVVHVEV